MPWEKDLKGETIPLRLQFPMQTVHDGENICQQAEKAQGQAKKTASVRKQRTTNAEDNERMCSAHSLLFVVTRSGIDIHSGQVFTPQSTKMI